MADFWDSWPVMLSPLYPRDGEAYDEAMRKAKEEYDRWLQRDGLANGIQVYTRPDTEDDCLDT